MKDTYAPDWRPEKRKRETREGWQTIATTKHGGCRACGWPHDIELHHLVPRGQRGDDVLENLVPLCRDCHRVITDHLPGWRAVSAALRDRLYPVELAYIRAKVGEPWLDDNYRCVA